MRRRGKTCTEWGGCHDMVAMCMRARQRQMQTWSNTDCPIAAKNESQFSRLFSPVRKAVPGPNYLPAVELVHVRKKDRQQSRARPQQTAKLGAEVKAVVSRRGSSCGLWFTISDDDRNTFSIRIRLMETMETHEEPFCRGAAAITFDENDIRQSMWEVVAVSESCSATRPRSSYIYIYIYMF